MSKPGGQFSHPKCYASCLRDCSTKVTREHFVSNGILRAIGAGGPVLTKGLRWQNEAEEQFIPTNRLVGKILCDEHNSRLAPLDSEALLLFAFLQEFQRGDKATVPKDAEIKIDGSLVERWMLKTICGFLASNNSPTHEPELQNNWAPPDWWVDILFDKVPMPDLLGLHFFGGVPPQTQTNGFPSGLQYRPLIQRGLGVYGAIFSLYTPGFLLSMALPPKKLSGTLLEHATRHPRNIVIGDGYFKHKVNFHWDRDKVGRPINITVQR